ncbi:hypothetical protein GCM10022207_75810 [Streptomyces lannensis]|uniref:Uncharacterized protein n=1 Tax=Streptomyces lannensis TaxID=766498 RepID=A0ABP7L9H1_9ACTN
MEICIAVADWARGPMTSVLGVPGGEGTGATRKRRARDARRRARRAELSGSTGCHVWMAWTMRTVGLIDSGLGAGMVAGWG